MDKKYFLAKSNKDKNGLYKTETIEEHTNNLLYLFEDFKNLYGNFFTKTEIDLIKIACEMHDLGKMNSRFQKKLYESIRKENEFQKDEELNKLYNNLKIREIPHGVLSAAFLDIPKLKQTFEDEYIEALASAIYNHHERKLLDKNGQKIKDADIKEIVEKDLSKYAKIYDKDKKCNFRGIKKNVIEEDTYNNYNFWLKFILIKGMLNKIDYAASAKNITKIEKRPLNASKYVENKFKEKNWNLNECQEFMKKNSDKNIVVIASTGIGKTEASLLWAEDYKTFYTLPLKVSINAIYERIIKENYYDKDKATFLHSDTISELMKKDDDIEFDDIIYRYKQTKLLTYPLTVCTIDQLFYFVFKSLGTEIFPATLKYSKIIIDEIQSYTPEITAFILYGLKVINDLGGRFCIMTATLPPIIKELMKEKNISFSEPDNAFFKKDNKGNLINRHFIKLIEPIENLDFNYENIIEKAKIKKVLIICNTVKRSQEVFNKLKEENSDLKIDLLHSRFILKDRKEKEKQILEFAPNNKKINNKSGIWISTQIVEASLDIDFDILHTDMCTADSLLQRMGRCFRDREYNEKEPNIFIYDTKIGVNGNKKSIYDKEIYDYSVEFIKKYNNKIFTEEDKQNYINNVYDTKRLKESNYKKSIIKNYETLEKLSPVSIEKSKAQELFREIDNVTIIPSSIYLEIIKKENNIFEQYKNSKKNHEYENVIKTRNEILNHTTNVPFYYIKNKDYSSSKPLELDKKNNIYIVDMKYDKDIGLLNKVDDEIFLSD